MGSARNQEVNFYYRVIFTCVLNVRERRHMKRMDEKLSEVHRITLTRDLSYIVFILFSMEGTDVKIMKQ